LTVKPEDVVRRAAGVAAASAVPLGARIRMGEAPHPSRCGSR
jgi:hypothetical protein